MCQQACSIKFLLSQVDVVFHQDQVAYRNDLSTRGFQPHHCCSNWCANRLHLEVQSKALVYSRSPWILEAKETSYHPIRAQWLNISTPGVSSTSSAEVAEVEDEVGSGEQKSQATCPESSEKPSHSSRCGLVTYLIAEVPDCGDCGDCV